MIAPTRLVVIASTFVALLLGWSVGGYFGAATGLAIGLAAGVIPWRGQPVWSWLFLAWQHRQPIEWSEPLTVANDRAGGGVRFQDGVAVAAVQLIGKAHTPTIFTGSMAAYSENAFDVTELRELLRQSLGLRLDSLSVVGTGSRRRATGDYPRVYDTLIGTPPYAGQRETWLIIRVKAADNAEALRWRSSVGAATVAAAQRVSAAMRQRGLRARVATATDIVELERRLGCSALQVMNRRWRSVRGGGGWLTTYWYRPDDITTEKLAQAWSLRTDGITHNVSLFADGSVTATVTVRSAQPPTAPPSLLMRPLPGEQAQAVAANMCGPVPALRGVRRGPPTGPLVVPIGPSGVLLGKIEGGNRLMMPLDGAGDFSRVHIAAEDAVAKRIVVRLAGAGERITVHTRNPQRWAGVRMPDIVISDRGKPVAGTTVSVVDGTVTPSPRPNTLISVGEPDAPYRGTTDVLITQTGPATLEVSASGRTHPVEVELFRAENRYVSEPVDSYR
ncbi:type VII secretion protein EccE [Mycobacterium intermedium]|uniref:Type VII secretion protein EccE n=1 Tax=Mycobacterium intermedium TaxID=28445 RepID=A0A1E3S905_MYCIE|nr:type VII secretion protein EccE [Mycobacterium intermedium]MCV6967323.1 type VII secretion protein EccE [Mycobacterium intermedium]ODQ98551.1 type VII secretion protein EccE [Mycobacterium intermedium]OPE46151.1 type VII secretion protein EccE [Mycobacterium intermedium]ORB08210.1 type VII secretion protein EccE [Mycobacterium intermedium]